MTSEVSDEQCLGKGRKEIYVDDFLLFADDKATLWGWKEAIVALLAHLRLTLHSPQVYPVSNGIPFLGFIIFPTHRRLKRRKGIAFQRRFKRLYQGWRRGAPSLASAWMLQPAPGQLTPPGETPMDCAGCCWAIIYLRQHELIADLCSHL